MQRILLMLWWNGIHSLKFLKNWKIEKSFISFIEFGYTSDQSPHPFVTLRRLETDRLGTVFAYLELRKFVDNYIYYGILGFTDTTANFFVYLSTYTIPSIQLKIELFIFTQPHYFANKTDLLILNYLIQRDS